MAPNRHAVVVALSPLLDEQRTTIALSERWLRSRRRLADRLAGDAAGGVVPRKRPAIAAGLYLR
jgi:hypothetical protein